MLAVCLAVCWRSVGARWRQIQLVSTFYTRHSTFCTRPVIRLVTPVQYPSPNSRSTLQMPFTNCSTAVATVNHLVVMGIVFRSYERDFHRVNGDETMNIKVDVAC